MWNLCVLQLQCYLTHLQRYWLIIGLITLIIKKLKQILTLFP